MRRSHWLHLALALAMAPWPQMRFDERNTARSPVPAVVSPAATPWEVRTGRSVLATPVIDRAGNAYFGAANGRVYAVGPGGAIRWTFRARGPVEASGLLIGRDLVIGSGGGTLYRLRTRPGLSPRKRVVWRFRSPLSSASGNGWTGSLSRHPDGDILAGHAGGGAHKITPAGRLVYVRRARDAVRAAPSTAADGTTFWGSLDRNVFALNEAGGVRWQTPTVGFVTGSPAVGEDGTVFGASFDGRAYALDAVSGRPRWAYETRDHVFGGPAVSETGGIVVGSADGALYGLSSEGRLAWRYDTGEPIRSSPVVGVTAAGEEVAYAGSSDGKLYAVDVATGARRWSFDTTATGEPELRDRNDLNGSPALSRGRVLIGTEHGSVWGIPYDYCLSAVTDARCETGPGDDELAESGTRVLPVTSAGDTRDTTQTVPSATTLTGRLLVRRDGETVDAAATEADVQAPFAATTALSGDGRFLHVVPDGFLEPDTDYEVRANGAFTAADGSGGTFDDVLRFRTEPLGTGPTLEIGAERVTAFALRRPALPLPALLPSIGLSGLDATDLIAGVVAAGEPDDRGERTVLLWVVGARRDARGRIVPDPRAGIAFPLAGSMRGDQFILRRDDVDLRFGFGDVRVRRLELRGALDPSGTSVPGTSLYAEVACDGIPAFGPLLVVTGTCDAGGTLTAGGTFLVSPFPRATRPPGVDVESVSIVRPTASRPGRVTAVLTGPLKARAHLASVLLVGTDGTPVEIDYATGTSTRTVRGDIRRVSVSIPAGTELPSPLLGAVMTDAFRLAVRGL